MSDKAYNLLRKYRLAYAALVNKGDKSLEEWPALQREFMYAARLLKDYIAELETERVPQLES